MGSHEKKIYLVDVSSLSIPFQAKSGVSQLQKKTHTSWNEMIYSYGIPLLPLTHQSTSLDTHKASPNQ